ncbi:glucocorticoid receptor-like (DNA-binding domain) [Lentinus brumalis]|nr:glucocorticoid receptor-like (DNA-binding domain) [Polyporus brumalis]
MTSAGEFKMVGVDAARRERYVRERWTREENAEIEVELDRGFASMPNARVLRDIKARHGVNANEILRRAYLYVARNQTLPPQVRFQAQLQLNTFGRYARPTTVQNRCTETGRGRGIISEFGLCRYQFRLKALAKELPGVKKASW